MKIILGVIAVMLVVSLGATLMIGAPSVMAVSEAYLDGYRQGSQDYIQGNVLPLIENPTHNPNITDFMNGHTQAWNDIFTGPWATAHFTKKELQRVDGWFAGANALAHNLTASPMGHNSDIF